MFHPESFSQLAAEVRRFISQSAPASGAGLVSGPATGSESDFNRLALGLFALQYGANKPYQRLCAARGVAPETVEHWSRIPAVPAAVFREMDVTCIAPPERHLAWKSSGTTSTVSSHHIHSVESLVLYESSLLAGFNACAAQAGALNLERCNILILTPSPAQAPDSSLVHMFETIARSWRPAMLAYVGESDPLGNWRLDLHAARKHLETVPAGHHPLAVWGTAFSFVHLLDHLAAERLTVRLPENSWALETGGYKGRSRSLSKHQLHKLIAARLGIAPHRILCEYGMCELSSQAYHWSAQGEFQFPPWVRVQVVSPETGMTASPGEPGLLRVHDLANVWSVMAVQTEDIARVPPKGEAECPTTPLPDTFELLGRAAFAELRGCSLRLAGE